MRIHQSKVLFLAILFLAINACSTINKTNYSVTQNGNEKILVGIINRSIIENDTAFTWLARDMKYITPSADAVSVFIEKKDKFNLVVFGGTWCEDSQNLLPKFYKLILKSGYPEKKIQLIGVDRNKKTIDDLQLKYKVTQVPTFIVMQKNKEIGRVVEYGKYNDIEKELAEIISKL